jgi:chromosomal replication initiator protein
MSTDPINYSHRRPRASSLAKAALAPTVETTNPPHLWQECLQYLHGFLPEQQIRTWLQPLHAELVGDGSGLKIYVASRFKMDYTRSQYNAIITKALEHVAGRPITPLFAVGKPKPQAPEKKPGGAISEATTNTTIAHQAPSTSSPGFGRQHKSAGELKERVLVGDTTPLDAPLSPSQNLKSRGKTEEGQHHLNPSLHFDNMVVGSANHMAHAAGMHVASVGADVNYNPLFVYGASGLGKTHLLHAIGNHYLKQHPKARVLYIHADKFVNDVVTAFRYNNFKDFRQLYANLDLLMIDDVQEFSVGDKAKTLEEFFYIFQTLLSKHSLIILTSDTYPKELSKIPERLVSRFVSGLTVALEPPQLEMRVAILLKKAEEAGIKLPEDVAFFIAKNVQSNVRELEGALRNVHAYAQFQKKGQGLSIHTAREALRDLLSAHKRQITIENIQKTVADYYHLKIADMHSKRRPANIAKPRQIAMYLAKEMTQKSLPEIGSSFGGRDHTTVLHAVKKINKEHQTDEQLRHELHILEQSLKG